jgi:peptide/nickel transport system substrate-binding protein
MRRRLPALVATAAILVAACGAATTTPSPSGDPSAPPASGGSASPSPAPTPLDFEKVLFDYTYEPTPGTPGGSVVISDWQAASQLNPVISTSLANSYVFAATMRALFTVTADGHWKPDLAAKMPSFNDDSIRVDADGTGFEVDVELLPNLKWSDGTPFTTADLKFTWEWILDPGQVGISTVGWENIDEVKITDDLNATFHFKEPFAGFYGTLSGYYLPKHYMETIPVADAPAKSYPLSPDIAKAVTIGPFKYVTASADTIELVRDDNWAGPAEACSGKACLDSVTYKFFPDNKEGMIAAFLAGEIDVAVDLVQADYDAIKDVDPAIGRAILEPAWLYEHFDMNQAGLGQGKGHPALKDLKVRQAIAGAIDKEAMWNTVFPGQPYPDVPLCVNATPTNYWQLPDAECIEYDLEAAKALLEEAGYKDSDGDGVREMPDGTTPLEFEHCTSTAAFRETGGEFLAGEMQKLGVKLNLNFVDSTAVLFANWPDVAADTKCNLAHGNYDTSEFAYVLSFDLFGDYYYSYHTEQIPTDANSGNGYNYLRFSNADMDAALDTLKSAIKPDEQLNAVWEVQQIYIDEVPEVVLYYRAEARGVAADLNNFLKNPGTSSDMWNIEDWWLTQ